MPRHLNYLDTIAAHQQPFTSPKVPLHVVHVGSEAQTVFDLRDADRPAPDRLAVTINGEPAKVASDDGAVVTLAAPAPAGSTVVFKSTDGPTVSTLALPKKTSLLAFKADPDAPDSAVMSKHTVRVDL